MKLGTASQQRHHLHLVVLWPPYNNNNKNNSMEATKISTSHPYLTAILIVPFTYTPAT